MVGDVGERGADDEGTPQHPQHPQHLEYGLSRGQSSFLEWVRRVAGGLADVEPVHGAVNRPLVKRMGQESLLRKLFGGDDDEPPRDAAAMQLCLLREGLAEVNTEAE